MEKHMVKGTSLTEIPLLSRPLLFLLKKVNLCTFRKDARVMILTKTAKIDIDALSDVEVVTGIFSDNPPNFFMSLMPVSYSTAPVFRNRRPLKTAWLKR
jgi:hypothetical protein